MPPPTMSPVVASSAVIGSIRPLAMSAGRCAIDARASSGLRFGMFAASRSSGSATATSRLSMWSSVGKRSTTVPSVMPSCGSESRRVDSRIPGARLIAAIRS